MTLVELRDMLINRIGWKQPTDSVYTVDASNQVSESGLYFQDEHACVSLDNIYYAMEIENANEAQFNEKLSDLKRQAIILVLTDVFRFSNVRDNILTDRENLFDALISKRMAIIIGELVITSKQSNRTQRITKEYQQKLFFELNGNADSTSARANENFPTFIGLKSRYGFEIEKVKDELDTGKALDSFTHRLPNYLSDDQNAIIYP
ncbi:hypothetical protein [Joostella sp. CR20]|uniref:hypothetical protein n=1 Tax=Joostella sp. CR20 TaxID=2804312 RepID=UPI00313C9B6C